MQQSSRSGRAQDGSQQVRDSSSEFSTQNREPHPDTDLIARRAYQRYEARGREDGYDMDDWLAAEQELGAVPMSEGSTQLDESDAD